MVKAGEAPDDWTENKRRQKDIDARWTKKGDKSHYGYKNHVNVDNAHKLIRKYTVTDASVHDSKQLDNLLDPGNTSRSVWADSAYRSEASLKAQGYRSQIHRKGARGKPLMPGKNKAIGRAPKPAAGSSMNLPGWPNGAARPCVAWV